MQLNFITGQKIAVKKDLKDKITPGQSKMEKVVDPGSQCWTEGRSSTAVAEDFRPTATATVAKVSGHSYGRRSYL